MEGTVFGPALEGMNHVKSEEGVMLTKQFLDVCKLIIPVIEKFGAAMTLVKSDVGGNITRLENKYTSNPTKYNHLYSMIQEEVDAKTAKGSSSCTNGLLWLTRAMDFLVQLFRNLLEHQDWAMSQACSDSYTKTLKKWHGWLASSTFTVAMKLAPDRKKFLDVIGGSGDINGDIEKFCSTFSLLLEENHKFLATVEDEKEPEMQIGLPTDVKHVAHIGWDGPSIDSPSWMKEFPSQTGFQSAPLGPPGELGENPEIKWVSVDSARDSKSAKSPRKDLPELPKSSRRHASADNNANNSPRKKDSSTKSRHSRRNQSKDSSEGGSVKSTRQPQESSQGTSSPSRDLPDIPKKSRRKKSKESVSGGGSTKSRSKGSNSNGTHAIPDTGPDDNAPTLRNASFGPSPIPSIHEEEDESRLKSNGR
ncbi:pleckstriny domain-containing family A member 8 [Dorcoceras hygrometricum]|uniref:Pleckstriny domain-containing family A member 8 n=1 Tax=Dorcoceras hygrometricum TaxID=472368 RepID=A0A2Z7AQ76_9LAMI|nr:pleckstriny domain-containing family A member 8 [Dorcoceras hygrometricum]